MAAAAAARLDDAGPLGHVEEVEQEGPADGEELGGRRGGRREGVVPEVEAAEAYKLPEGRDPGQDRGGGRGFILPEENKTGFPGFVLLGLPPGLTFPSSGPFGFQLRQRIFTLLYSF